MTGTGDRVAEDGIRNLSDGTLYCVNKRRHTMAKQDDHPLNDANTPTPQNENRARKSWAEEHGGLIFLIIVFGGISFVILYELFIYSAR
jgi:hypothetical protein